MSKIDKAKQNEWTRKWRKSPKGQAWYAGRDARTNQRLLEACRKVGISMVQYEDQLVFQGGRCAIFSCVATKLVMDHCHETGKFRGLICRQHNAALGKFGDNIEGVRAVLQYLEER